MFLQSAHAQPIADGTLYDGEKGTVIVEPGTWTVSVDVYCHHNGGPEGDSLRGCQVYYQLGSGQADVLLDKECKFEQNYTKSHSTFCVEGPTIIDFTFAGCDDSMMMVSLLPREVPCSNGGSGDPGSGGNP